ncbi:hypothetical protein HP467_06945 [Curtobacterium albidum]|uniref:Antitoxin VbhA domain-containing protein n=1 Tax=Curtobacterium citreum TaxID=2036 RepID=A0A850DUM6_9MICO|nr:hypothetical protein [Curtobacterium albidum]NUU27850.1 hypothetical protein [Curtobacterium albidum]
MNEVGKCEAADEVERRMEFVDAALEPAGYEVTDPALRKLSHRVAADTMGADDAIAAGMTYVEAQ